MAGNLRDCSFKAYSLNKSISLLFLLSIIEILKQLTIIDWNLGEPLLLLLLLLLLLFTEQSALLVCSGIT